MRLCSCLCFFFLGCCSLADEPITVSVGQPFSAMFPLQIPPESAPNLRLHLQTLLYSRPLPAPFLLESFVVDEQMRLHIQGRIMQQGEYDVFLGLLPWRGSFLTLPSFFVVSSVASFSPQFLIPYPQHAVTLSSANNDMLKTCLAKNQMRGNQALSKRRTWRHASGFLLLAALCAPLVPFLCLYLRPARRVVSRQITPQELLADIDVLRSRDVPWTKLVQLLNLLALPASGLTSYELEAYFAQAKKTPLANAAKIIEEFGYQQVPNDDRFDAAKELVKEYIQISFASPR